MRRTLLTEVVVGVVVLGVTGVLVAQPPGKVSLAAERAKPKSATVAVTADATARVEIAPGTHGDVEVEVVLSGSITPTAVTATASLPAKSLGPIPVKLQSAGPKSYTASGVLLPAAGAWQISLTVQTSEFDSTTAVAVVHLS
jgi:copper transport protein